MPARHGATANTKTVVLGLGLLMAAPGVWLPLVNAAPASGPASASGGVSLDAIASTNNNNNNNHVEAKSLDNTSIVAKRDNGTTTTKVDYGEEDPWLMPNDKFYEHFLDDYWTKRSQSSAHARSSLVGLAQRKKRTVPTYDAALYCGIFSTGYMETLDALLWDFKKTNNIINYIIGWRECRRLACKDTSGIYICNDTTQTVRVTGQRVYDLGKIPSDNCCHQGPADAPTKKAGHGMSGQKFTGTGFNVILAYANCNFGEKEYRPSKGPPDNPWGPNQECVTEFFGLSPSPTNDQVYNPLPRRGVVEDGGKKRGERIVVEEPEWELVDDGTGIMDLVEKRGGQKKKRELVKVDEDEARLMRRM
ncbi:hypothetical protein B0T20DRAFT_365263 [Sordaria brevicollis]|uniref:Uncharacterized protein n=1 Tax=Sordaria brevicollis TaxID=83679 RepID=A0AAE0U2M2_SORBR|nr:hypothetical protein B0T20DRAFT_365263 [Sordaria brevicollis]